jgi:O-antigen ligase
VLFLFSVAVLVLMDRRKVPLPWIAPLAALLLVGLLSLTVSPTGGGLLTLAVDAYLIALMCGIACFLQRNETALTRLLTVWSLAAIGWGVLLLGSHYGFLPERLADLLDANTPSRRAAAAAHNPNLAASYLATSVFVLLSAPRPKGVVRVAGMAILVLAVWATGSNGALLGLAAAGGLVGTAAALRRVRPTRRLGTWGVLLAGAAVTVGVLLSITNLPQPGSATVSRIARENSSGAFADTLGRLDLSVSSRERIWSGAAAGIQDSPIVGVGPGQAARIRTGEGVLGKGLHNDYLAALVERGILGLLALTWFVVAVLRDGLPLLARNRIVASGTWRPAGLTAAIGVNLVIALTHESLHFRHLWVLLALTWVATRLPTYAPAAPKAVQPDSTHQASMVSIA